MSGMMDGKVALVTGAGSGIGKGVALAFAREGAKVAVADKVLETAKETMRMIKESGSDAMAVPCDVTRETDVKAMIHAAVDTLGRLDYAVNNAGIEAMPIPLAEYPLDVWNQVLSVNLTGVFLCLKHEIAQMLKQGKGAIVNIASVAGLIGTPLIAAYTATKHGVVGLTKTAALEYAQSGIRVNAVCPGATQTPMGDRLIEQHPEVAEMLLKIHPMGRIADVKEMAAAVLWLCSDSASFVTGQALAVDGGYVAQ
jgi:NAD(P)-dependent dehydrogenase (short-subunit alcohol dehydrogenase family)